MLAVIFVYAGLAAMLIGAVTFVKPLVFLRISNRRRAAVIFGGGLLAAVVGMILPAREMRVTTPRMRLDEFAPVYQFNEVHAVRVSAPRAPVYQAVKAVSADEILFFHTLTWIRRLGRQGPESILNPPEHLPILEVATRSGFIVLAEEPDREIVLGAVVLAPGANRTRELAPQDFKSLGGPGLAFATMNFLVEDAGADSSIVRTETRVYATDRPSEARFARYWRVIYPGSALIRRMWLRAVKNRAER